MSQDLRCIRAVFFDVGGVLLSYSTWKIADKYLDRELVDKFPDLDIRQLHKTWEKEWSRRHRAAPRNGFETMREQAEKSLHKSLILLGCEATGTYVKRMLGAWYRIAEACVKAMPNAVNVLEELKASGYKIGIITNADWNVVIPHLRRTGLLDYIDYKIVSSRLRTYKPSPELFREAVRVSKLRPEEILFVGDSIEVDIEPAKKIGMRPLLFSAGKKNSCTIISTLKELLRLLPS